jgi:acetate kinase
MDSSKRTGDIPAAQGMMAPAVLVLNGGSSNLKFSVFVDDHPPRALLRGQIERAGLNWRFVARDGTRVIVDEQWPPGTHRTQSADLVEFLFEWCRSGVLQQHRIAAVGHRIVHGGATFSAPCLVDGTVVAELSALIPLAPLHQPHNLAAVRAIARFAPELPQVACFDTAFHRGQPPLAQAFALPRRFQDEGLKRYGFHGLSYEYVASVLPEYDARIANGRTIVAHLGSGSSLCALEGGRSIATTMSFTTLDGLMMGTRCGTIDPGVILYLLERHHLAASDLQHLLYEESGLLGVSEITSDMRELLASGDRRAAEAVDLFVYRIGRELGSMAAALHGLDAIVFTGGIGENAAVIRERVCRDAAWLGVEPDAVANVSGGPRISTASSRVSAWVIPTNEEALIARHTCRLAFTALNGGCERNGLARRVR